MSFKWQNKYSLFFFNGNVLILWTFWNSFFLVGMSWWKTVERQPRAWLLSLPFTCHVWALSASPVQWVLYDDTEMVHGAPVPAFGFVGFPRIQTDPWRLIKDELVAFWQRQHWTQLWFSKRNFGVALTPRERKAGELWWERLPLTCWVSGSGASPLGASAGGEEKRSSKTHRMPDPPTPSPAWMEYSQLSLPCWVWWHWGGSSLPDLPHLSALVCHFLSFGGLCCLRVGAGHPADPTSPDYDGKTE